MHYCVEVNALLGYFISSRIREFNAGLCCQDLSVFPEFAGNACRDKSDITVRNVKLRVEIKILDLLAT